jgi:hypothetical protein
MSFQFVVQRDLDGTWSVRERTTNVPAVTADKPLSGLSEKAAVQHARMLNKPTRSSHSDTHSRALAA